MPRIRLSPDRRALVEEYIPVAMHIAKRFASAYGIDRRELISIAYEAMVESAEDWDRGRGTAKKFFSFRVQAKLIEHLRIESRRFRRLPFTIRIEWDHPDPRQDDMLAFDDRRYARWLLAKARPRDRKALRAVYLEGKTRLQAARKVGVTHGYVRVLLDRGIADIRSFIACSPETP